MNLTLEERKHILKMWQDIEREWQDNDVGGETQEFFMTPEVCDCGIAELSMKHGAERVRELCDNLLKEMELHNIPGTCCEFCGRLLGRDAAKIIGIGIDGDEHTWLVHKSCEPGAKKYLQESGRLKVKLL